MEQPVHSSQFLSPWKAPVPELQTWPEHLCVPRHLARDPGSQIPHQGVSKARGSAVHTHTQAQPDRDVSAHPGPGTLLLTRLAARPVPTLPTPSPGGGSDHVTSQGPPPA